MVLSKKMHKEFKFNDQGLIPAIAQEASSGLVLMMAWMNREAFERTVETGYATYFSRARQSLWKKGEQSGNFQKVKEILLDCDVDTLLLKVEQVGEVACHTGRRSCFFRRLEEKDWVIFDKIIKLNTYE